MRTLIALMIIISVFGISACSDGNAEQAGEKIDETLTELENTVEDACEKAKEGLKLEDQDC